MFGDFVLWTKRGYMKLLVILSTLFMISAPLAGTLEGSVGWDNGRWFCAAENNQDKTIVLKSVHFTGDNLHGIGQKWIPMNKSVPSGESVNGDKLYLAQINEVRSCTFQY